VGVLPTLEGVDERARTVFEASTSEVQLRSKRWLVANVDRLGWFDDTTVLVLGGWCGVLGWVLHRHGPTRPTAVVSVDLDLEAGAVGRRVLAGSVPALSFLCQDVLDLDYHRLAATRDLIVVNTICEHMPAAAFERWRAMLPPGLRVVLQSNDYRGCPDHVHCVDSTEELAASAELADVVTAGALDLGLFTRFMVAGWA
jgi:hypothetical protein